MRCAPGMGYWKGRAGGIASERSQISGSRAGVRPCDSTKTIPLTYGEVFDFYSQGLAVRPLSAGDAVSVPFEWGWALRGPEPAQRFFEFVPRSGVLLRSLQTSQSASHGI